MKPSGGLNQPVRRLKTPLPMYWKNCVWSLHAAGSVLYLPQFRLGAPRACGPLNARIVVVNFRRGELRHSDLVDHLRRRQDLAPRDDHPRVGGELRLLELGERLVEGHGALVRLVGGKGRGDAVDPRREIAAEARGHLTAQAERIRDDLRALHAELVQRLRDVDAARGVALRDDDVGRLRPSRGERTGQVGRIRVEAHELRRDARGLEARLLDLGADVDSRNLRIDDGGGLRIELRLRERAPRTEHRVVRPEEREVELPLAVDGQQRDAADDRLLAAERRVERLVTDRDRAEQDDGDSLVVRELLSALRPLFLGRGREAGADLQRMALDAPEVLVDVVHGRLDALRPAGPNEDLASLRVDGADHDRRELRVRRAGLPADVGHVVRNRSACRFPSERDRDRDGECNRDGPRHARNAARTDSLYEPHCRRASFFVVFAGRAEESSLAARPRSSQSAHKFRPI